MTRQIPERDWKICRELKPFALDRFCQRVLQDVVKVAGDAERTPHQRYGAIYGLIAERDKELARAFDGLRRSTALFQLAHMHTLRLITEEELQRFSPDTRESITFLSGRGK